MSKPIITVRPATPADAPVLGRLGALLVALHHDFDQERFIAATPQTEQGYGAFLAGELNRDGAFVLVAEDRRGEVIGYVYAGLEGQDWMALRGPAGAIYDIIVDPAHRGGGVSRKLLDEVLSRLAETGAPRMVLSTATHNDAARKLFASAGFRPTMIEMTREAGG